jgi:hypothetical protein
MTGDTKSAKRLAELQKRVAQQKRLEWVRNQRELGVLAERSEALAKTLDGGGLAWQLFPEMSSRHLGRLVSEMATAKENADQAALVSMHETKRLEKLEQRYVQLHRCDEQRKDDEQRLENATRQSRSSLPQA